MRKLIKHITISAVIFVLLYIVLGAVLPYTSHKEVNAEQANSELKYYGKEVAERLLVIDDNTEALEWRLRVIESAKKEIALSTFVFKADNSGIDIMSSLMNAADRGVHVRVLVDGTMADFNLLGKSSFKAFAAHPNIEVKFYNPINLLKPWKLNACLHDKYLIADDSVYILGGRNTHDVSLGNYKDKRDVDRDVLVYSSAPSLGDSSVSALLSYFEEMWSLECNKPIVYEQSSKITEAADELYVHYNELKKRIPTAFEAVDYMSETFPVNSIALLTNPKEPINKEPLVWHNLCKLMKSGKRITIQTPYVICSENMYNDIKEICDSTEYVELVTNSVETGANLWGCVDYLNQKKNILATGVYINEFSGERSSHSKAVLIDDNISILGSYNLDMRSTYIDTEIMLVIDSKELNEKLRTSINSDIEKSRQVSPDGSTEQGTEYQEVSLPFYKKVLYGILRIIIIPFRCLL